MSNALKRLPQVSPTISVPPSGVMTEPFGKRRPSAATVTVPSGSTRFSDAEVGAPPPMRSKPKSPTNARPWASTTMSFRWPPQTPDRSACVDTSPSARRSSRWSFIETTSSDPSGSQPRPDGWFSTSRTTVSPPSGFTRLTVCR
jgi:hypothetical protein